ncbi:MAG TPA: prolyl oligopeptidase family serine peptidase [Gemmataceae bacterium]|nr:prolyl oligopeptidase family serine peptidase [Gemmataceae bacterium]
MRTHAVALTFIAALTAGLLAGAADEPASKPGDDSIDAYLAQEAAKLSERALDGAKTREEWEARRPRLRQEYFDMLGLWPLPEKTPLNAKVTGTLERGDVTIEKLYFQSRPGLYVTGDLYRPKKSEGQLPAILYVCGHSNKGRDGNKTDYQDHGMWFASNGYVCLIIDTVELGEIHGEHHGTYSKGRWWWHSAGYTPAGVECWNGVRAIDYLISRPDVDPDRIGVTGISGGGAATVWIAAADERVKCAAQVSGMSDLECYVSEKVVNHHCDCMLFYNMDGWDWTAIAALIAPRPFLFANSDADSLFPMDGNRRIVDRLRTLYGFYGKSDLLDEYVSRGGHGYRLDLRVAVFQWINKHLKKDAGPVKDADFPPIAGKDLRVFPEDKDIPQDALNVKIDETFVPRAEVKPPTEGEFAAWKKGLMAGLRERPFHAFPDRIPAAANTGDSVKGPAGGSLLTTEPPLRVLLTPPKSQDAAKDGLLIVLNPDEDVPAAPPEWAEPYAAGTIRMISPRGGKAYGEWTKASPPNYVRRAEALLGRTVDEGRVWDVAATVRYLNEQDKGMRTWRVAGRGQAGVIAAYAALFEPSIKEVIVVDPPASHMDGPYFLGVLRVLDTPDALGMLAPTPLTLIGAKDKAFDRTEQIYQAAGAADKLHRK